MPYKIFQNLYQDLLTSFGWFLGCVLYVAIPPVIYRYCTYPALKPVRIFDFMLSISPGLFHKVQKIQILTGIYLESIFFALKINTVVFKLDIFHATEKKNHERSIDRPIF